MNHVTAEKLFPGYFWKEDYISKRRFLIIANIPHPTYPDTRRLITILMSSGLSIADMFTNTYYNHEIYYNLSDALLDQ
jgi:NurA-like 5'-3' nuclease